MSKDEALKMAIEALNEAEQMSMSEYSRQGDYEKAIQACKEALEQPTAEQSSLVQEPVASRFKLSDGNYSLHNNQYDFGEPLYTHPKKEWQGLSDDEIGDIWVVVGVKTPMDFSRAIEAKLKEKNT